MDTTPQHVSVRPTTFIRPARVQLSSQMILSASILPYRSNVHQPAVVRVASIPTYSVADVGTNDALFQDTPGSLDTDTIAAIVTGVHQGAVSIIRLSGIDAVEVAAQVFHPAGHGNASQAWHPETHRVYYGHAYDVNGQRIDEVLAIVMLAPRSFTAEDVVEIHAHGGGICAQRVLRACLSAGARLARPGEFSLRAFLNGRIDLSQAESVAALVDARTVAAADSALAGLAGGLGEEVTAMRSECVDMLVELDARLDFDEDLPPLDVDAIATRIDAAAERVRAALSTARQGQLLRNGLQVALLGRPNAGKSSLLNALSGTNRSIVTEIAGTTRDVVEAGFVIGGVPITLLDTAGVRHASDEVERIGVERSVATAKAADIVVMVTDGAAGWSQEDVAIYEILREIGCCGGCRDAYSDTNEKRRRSEAPPSLLVINKSDAITTDGGSIIQDDDNGDENGDVALAAVKLPADVLAGFAAVVETSALTGAGLDSLRDALLDLAGAPGLAPQGVSWAVNERQAEALLRAEEALLRVKESVGNKLPVDFWTIDLRAAVLALGEVNGEEVTEEVLDNVFSRFCIGK